MPAAPRRQSSFTSLLLTNCLCSTDLTDDPGLCGGFLIWLTSTRKDRLWLSGRFLSATWDADELLSMREAIVKSDMLKARMVVT